MRAEDLGVLAGTLISPKERKAFESRLEKLQKIIKERLKQDEKLPESEKTIISKEEWNSQKTSEKLQDKIWKGNPQFCSSMLGRNKVVEYIDEGEHFNVNIVCHVQGATNGADSEMKLFNEMYYKLRSSILSKEKGMERYLALTNLLSDIYVINYEVGEMLLKEDKRETKDAKSRRLIYENVIQRLVDEFVDSEAMKAHFNWRVELSKKLKEAYDEMDSRVKEIPREFLDNKKIEEEISRITQLTKGKYPTEEVAKEQVTEKIMKDVRKQYIWACIKKENPELIYENGKYSMWSTALGNGFKNRQLNSDFLNMYGYMDRESRKFENIFNKKNGAGAFNNLAKYAKEADDVTLNLEFISQEFTKDFLEKEKSIGRNYAKNLGVDIDNISVNPAVHENKQASSRV